MSRLSKLGIDFPYMVAPMVGLSHVAFRELIRAYTPIDTRALLFTEMLSTRRIPSEHLDRAETLLTAPGESFLVPQLLGNEEEFIAASIRRLLPLRPWGFDINMGCPATHTLKHNWGVLLMGDLDYAARVVQMAKRHSPVPVSVKMRNGQTNRGDLDYLLRFTEALETAGADWLTIHCRPREMRHRGAADWSIVSEVAKRRSIPVVANGDVQTADDALKLTAEYQVDGAMIARAATARPWILWQIAHRLGIKGAPPGRAGELPPQTPEEEGREYIRAVIKFIDLVDSYFPGSPHSLRKVQLFLRFGSVWYLYGHDFWRKTQKAKCLADVRDIVGEYGQKHSNPTCGRVAL